MEALPTHAPRVEYSCVGRLDRVGFSTATKKRQKEGAAKLPKPTFFGSLAFADNLRKMGIFNSRATTRLGRARPAGPSLSAILSVLFWGWPDGRAGSRFCRPILSANFVCPFCLPFLSAIFVGQLCRCYWPLGPGPRARGPGSGPMSHSPPWAPRSRPGPRGRGLGPMTGKF